MMTIAQLITWSSVIPQLIQAGILVEGQVAALLKSSHPQMTDADLNAIALILIGNTQSALAIAKRNAG